MKKLSQVLNIGKKICIYCLNQTLIQIILVNSITCILFMRFKFKFNWINCSPYCFCLRRYFPKQTSGSEMDKSLTTSHCPTRTSPTPFCKTPGTFQSASMRVLATSSRYTCTLPRAGSFSANSLSWAVSFRYITRFLTNCKVFPCWSRTRKKIRDLKNF